MPCRQRRAWGVHCTPRAREGDLALHSGTHLCVLLDAPGCLQWGQFGRATETMALEPCPSALRLWANN